MKNTTTSTLKLITLMLLTVLLSGLVVGCGTATNENSVTTEEVPVITLGLLPSIDAIPFIIAHQQGFDQEHGVNLNIQTFKSAKDRDVAFQAGKLDGISADLIAIAIYNEAGLDVKVTSTTFGEFDLLTGADEVTDVQDLKGKTIILSKNTSTEYTVAMMLRQAGLTEQDVIVTEVPQIPTRLELLKSNKADAAILPEPYVTIGESTGLRILTSTKEAGVNPFIMAFPQQIIDTKEKQIQAMYAAYDDAVDYMRSHDQSEYIDLIISEVGYPDSLKDSIIVPNYVPANQVNVQDVDAAFAWAREKGLLSKNILPEEVISNVAFKK